VIKLYNLILRTLLSSWSCFQFHSRSLSQCHHPLTLIYVPKFWSVWSTSSLRRPDPLLSNANPRQENSHGTLSSVDSPLPDAPPTYAPSIARAFMAITFPVSNFVFVWCPLSLFVFVLIFDGRMEWIQALHATRINQPVRPYPQFIKVLSPFTDIHLSSRLISDLYRSIT